MKPILVLALIASCTDHGAEPMPDAAIAPCPGETIYPRAVDVASCTVADIRPGAGVPPKLEGEFPFTVTPAPQPGFVIIRDVFVDPFDGNIAGTWYTLAHGDGFGGPLENGCAFDPCQPGTEIHTCASLDCADISQLDDPACVQTGARCSCHGQECAP
jgi:hypothetical protein